MPSVAQGGTAHEEGILRRNVLHVRRDEEVYTEGPPLSMVSVWQRELGAATLVYGVLPLLISSLGLSV